MDFVSVLEENAVLILLLANLILFGVVIGLLLKRHGDGERGKNEEKKENRKKDDKRKDDSRIVLDDEYLKRLISELMLWQNREIEDLRKKVEGMMEGEVE